MSRPLGRLTVSSAATLALTEPLSWRLQSGSYLSSVALLGRLDPPGAADASVLSGHPAGLQLVLLALDNAQDGLSVAVDLGEIMF